MLVPMEVLRQKVEIVVGQHVPGAPRVDADGQRAVQQHRQSFEQGRVGRRRRRRRRRHGHHRRRFLAGRRRRRRRGRAVALGRRLRRSVCAGIKQKKWLPL